MSATSVHYFRLPHLSLSLDAFLLADNLAEKLEIDDIARVPKDFILNSDAASFHSKDALSLGSKDLERGFSAKWYPGGRRAP